MAKFRYNKRFLEPNEVIRLMRDQIIKQMRPIGDTHIAERKKVTATWNEPPYFSWRVSSPQFDILVFRLWVLGPTWKKWLWLEEGTQVRHAQLSRNWVSKTRPGFIGSVPGRGRVKRVRKDLQYPGIQERRWDRIINRSLDGRTTIAVQTGARAGLRLTN